MASTSASTSSDPPTPALVIETADGQIFELSEEQANLIGLFRDMLDFTDGNVANHSKKDGKSSTTTESNKSATNNSSIPSSAGPSKPGENEKMKKAMVEEEKPIAVNVDGATMSLVLQWLHQHKDDTEEIKGIYDEAFRERTLPEWDQAFFRPLKYLSLAKLITAANYLDINNLLFYTAKATVGNMNNMTIGQMRAYTTVKEDGLTLEMEKKVHSKQDGEKKEEEEKMEEN